MSKGNHMHTGKDCPCKYAGKNKVENFRPVIPGIEPRVMPKNPVTPVKKGK